MLERKMKFVNVYPAQNSSNTKPLTVKKSASLKVPNKLTVNNNTTMKYRYRFLFLH